MSSALSRDVALLLDEARAELRPALRPMVDEAAERLQAPLRVAIAGQVKAGKSTLLNALVGQKMAPTDASECTRIVTWYRNGPTYRVTLHMTDGRTSPARFWRDDGALEVDLSGHDPTDVEKIDVEWPSQRLSELVLIDTPGLGSLTEGVSERTERLLTGAGSEYGEADAVIYLIRHLHPGDVDFLEAFRDRAGVGGVPITAIGVLSRADEIGDCRVGAMAIAEAVAERARSNPHLAGLCHVVLPVAGLVAEAAATVREGEIAALRRLAAADRGEANAAMLSVGRLLADGQVCGLGEVERRQLVERLGLFGIRLAVELLRRAPAMRSSDLSAQLLGRSGLLGLRELLLRQFGARAQVLKARSALALLAQLARTDRSPQGAALLDRVRTVELSAHELRELALLQQLRQPGSGNGSLDRDEVARLLGDEGAEPWRRLALDAGASQDDIRTAALEQIGRWRSHAEDPIVDGSERDLARAVVRSCEGIVAELPTPEAG